MFSRLRGFLYRHRRKFIISGVLVSGVILATRYTQRKLREWQERETQKFIDRTKRQQHYESTERTCDQTILSLAVSLRDSVTKALDTESIVNKLRDGSAEKITLWNELKVVAISRSAALIYSSTMLVVILRIQLNLIGGYMFKDSKNNSGDGTVDGAIQQEYLSLCEYFMDNGVVKLSAFIKEKVEEITASVSLKERLSIRDLEQIYWAITSAVSADSSRDPVKNLAMYTLPPNCDRASNDILSKMTVETVDLLESEEVQTLLRSTVRSGFVSIVDHVSEYFFDTALQSNGATAEACASAPGPSNRKDSSWVNTVEKPVDACYTNGFISLNKMSMPMAKLIPIVNGQVPAVPRPGDVPSDWLQQLILNDNLKTLGANVYEAFSF